MFAFHADYHLTLIVFVKQIVNILFIVIQRLDFLHYYIVL